MVCCDVIRVMAPVWSCLSCFHVFHLNCIKKWARSPAASQADGTAVQHHVDISSLVSCLVLCSGKKNKKHCFVLRRFLFPSCPDSLLIKWICFNHQINFMCQNWTKGESVFLFFPDSAEGWRCPACQNVSLKQPTTYTCFCGERRFDWSIKTRLFSFSTSSKSSNVLLCHRSKLFCIKQTFAFYAVFDGQLK